VFLDPSGSHLIISMTSGDNWYLHQSMRTPKPLSSFKGHVIESIAWDKQNSESNTTREILVGTTTGIVFEVIIEAVDRLFSSTKERGFAKVRSLTHSLTHSLTRSLIR